MPHQHLAVEHAAVGQAVRKGDDLGEALADAGEAAAGDPAPARQTPRQRKAQS